MYRGTADHMHITPRCPPPFIQQGGSSGKGHSSKWIHDTFLTSPRFPGKMGTARLASVSHVRETAAYIKDQPEHHRTKSFQESTLLFPGNTRSITMTERLGLMSLRAHGTR